ncbi:efflux RND transporter periplasmic adaptor subunit [Azohydromonas aeria]|uniref:efflux RND transporter periplasmic adaptor subunit n=1 Tax=Azohydromonas aeria TaxID=2590212 RepID=UPI0012FC266C|nr:efflux RND transporter periplasmic adaptor subunit [Azohydromonas aeria]
MPQEQLHFPAAAGRVAHSWWSGSVISLACAAVLVLAGCARGDAKAPPQAPQATEVGIVTLAAQPLALRTELAGRTVAARIAEIRPQVGGIVRERLFREGSVVRVGQPLYQIDAASYEAAVRSALAGVARAQATLDAAQLKARRQQELMNADAGTRQDLEDAQAALQQAKADLDTAQATLASAEIDLARTRIAAPIAGRIETSTVTPGALVTANQTMALTTVQQLDPILVDVPQSSVEVLKLRRQIASGALQGGEVAIRLKLEDGSTYAHAGKLQVSGVTVNTTSGAVTLRAKVPNPDGLLLPGMYVRAVLEQAQDPAAILAPQAGISRNARGEASALVVGADDKVQRRAVTVAEAVDGRWRVTQGLQSGDRLIVEGTGKVREGQIVRPVAAGAAVVAQAAPAADAASAAR